MIRVEGFAGTLDLVISPGAVVLLKGPTGSGKTSLLRTLAGLSAPLDAARVETTRAAWSPQHARDALVGLTVRGEWRLRGRAYAGLVPPDRDVATLSAGEARRLALDLADCAAPLLLLDEPAEGLDADGRARLLDLVRRSRDAIVVAADHAGVLDEVATRVVALGETDDAPLPEVGEGFHVLVGPNGSGKTTRLRRLAREAAGSRFASAEPVFTRVTVRDEVARADAWIVEALVPREILDRHPLTLSGGEAQRASLARTLGQAAPLYLLDEPEAHLDAAGRRALVGALRRRIEEGAVVLAATHDEALARLASTRTVMG